MISLQNTPRIDVALDASDEDHLRIASQYPLSRVISGGLENVAFAADHEFQSAVDQVYQAMESYAIARAALETVLRALTVKRPYFCPQSPRSLQRCVRDANLPSPCGLNMSIYRSLPAPTYSPKTDVAEFDR
jgi:hypothetical protein